MSNRIVDMQVDYAQMTQQQALCSRMRDDVKQLENVVEELHSTVAHSLQECNFYHSTLNDVLTKGVESGLSLVSCVPGASKGKDWYTIYPVDIQFSGMFSELQRFLKTLALQDYPLRIKHIAIANKKNEKLLIRCVIYVIGVNDKQETS